jgi:hypothetical protein
MGILLSWTNLVEGVGVNLAANSEAAGLGLRGLLTPQISEIWRSAGWGATAITLDVDLGSAQGFKLIALAAPRDGLLPSAGATLSLGASLTAPPSAANLQASPTSIVPGGGAYVIGPSATNLGAVADPAGGTGARRLGSSSASGANVYLGRSVGLPVAPNTPYEFAVSARGNAAAPAAGTLMTIDEYAGANLTGALTRRVGLFLVGSGIDATWRRFSRRITTRADTQSLQIYWAEGWQTGAEIELYGTSITRRPEVLDTGDQPFSLAPFGIWAWLSTTGITARYLRLSFTGTATDAYLQLGRLWIGPALITARQASLGHSLSVIDPGSSARAGISGVRDIQRGRPYRALNFAGDTLTSAEASQLDQALLAVGTTGQVFAARLHSDPAGTGCFGVLARAPTITRLSPQLWRAEIAIEEDL